MRGSTYSVLKKRLPADTGNQILNECLEQCGYIDPNPYAIEATFEVLFGKVKIEIPAFKITRHCGRLPEFGRMSENDENFYLKDLLAKPYVVIDISDCVGIKISDGDGSFWEHFRGYTRANIIHVGRDRYLSYSPGDKFESVAAILATFVLAGKFEVEPLLKKVIVAALNRKFHFNVETIDLAGMDETVTRCLTIVNNTDQRLVNRHILFAGPPGTGKSELVKELIRRTPEWIHIPLYRDDIANLVSKIGSINRIMRYTGNRVMLIIDELDEVGVTRDKGVNPLTYNLLRVMDGVSDANMVKFVATTNRTDDIDTALLRIGRFGPVYKIDRPDITTTRAIVNMYAERFAEESELDETDLGVVAEQMHTQGATGCMIRASFENCVIDDQPITAERLIQQLGCVMEQP